MLSTVRDGPAPSATLTAVSADEPVLVKVRKLLAKAEATQNPHEADAFAAKAAALIAAHRIDTARLAAAGRTEALTIRSLTIGRGAYVRARLALLGAVAGSHDCELVWVSSADGAVAKLAGFASDLDATAVLYESLHLQAASRMAAVRRATPAATQRWRRAFLFGYAARVRRDPRRGPPRRRGAHPNRQGTTLPDLPGRAAQVSELREDGVRAGRAGLGAGGGGGRRLGARPPRGVGCRRRAGAARGAAAAGSRVSGDDLGRAATYAAEEDAASAAPTSTSRRPLEELVALAATVTVGAWWADVRRAARCAWQRHATAGASRRRPATGRAVVVVDWPAGQRTPGTLTHELAHALAGVVHAGHDARFRAAHVDVVALVAGAGCAGRPGREPTPPLGLAVGDRRWPSPVPRRRGRVRRSSRDRPVRATIVRARDGKVCRHANRGAATRLRR